MFVHLPCSLDLASEQFAKTHPLTCGFNCSHGLTCGFAIERNGPAESRGLRPLASPSPCMCFYLVFCACPACLGQACEARGPVGPLTSLVPLSVSRPCVPACAPARRSERAKPASAAPRRARQRPPPRLPGYLAVGGEAAGGVGMVGVVVLVGGGRRDLRVFSLCRRRDSPFYAIRGRPSP